MSLVYRVESGGMVREVEAGTERGAAIEALRQEVASGSPAPLGLLVAVTPEPVYFSAESILREIGAWKGPEGVSHDPS